MANSRAYASTQESPRHTHAEILGSHLGSTSHPPEESQSPMSAGPHTPRARFGPTWRVSLPLICSRLRRWARLEGAAPPRRQRRVVPRVACARSCRHWHHCQPVRALHRGYGGADGRPNGGHIGSFIRPKVTGFSPPTRVVWRTQASLRGSSQLSRARRNRSLASSLR